MARSALQPEAFPKHEEAVLTQGKIQSRVSKIKGKKLKDLTPKQKDLLLKELAIRAGLLQDDGDD
jgi:hypothetical protein